MGKVTKAALIGAGLLGAWTAWGLYTNRSADTVPYTVLEDLDGIEIREYPEAVLAETNARSELIAFRRLFDYIAGANERRESVSMTAPVRTAGGQSLSMTAPVKTAETDDKTVMGFYLPSDYDLDSAPKPTDGAVELRSMPSQTLAVVQFSWYATENRVMRYERRLLRKLQANGIKTAGAPFLLRYNDPWTPPFMRRNEVAVEIESEP